MANENEISVSGIQIEWLKEKGTCSFRGLPVAMMWVDSTLSSLMQGVQSMVGLERFNLALQAEGRKGIDEDWKFISQFPTFELGFKDIARTASAAGWGLWELSSIDRTNKICCYRVYNSWEGIYQKHLQVCWGSNMVAGKFSGYTSMIFGTNCWAEQTKFIARGDNYDEFIISASNKTIENEINLLLHTDQATRADMAVALTKLTSEVKQRKLAQKEAYQLAFYDHLTNLPNRRFLADNLTQLLHQAKTNEHYCCALFIDVDDFKNINDSLGHLIGDELLVLIAKRLSYSIRHTDILARIGGDEFLIVLQNMGSSIVEATSNARLSIEKIFQILKNPFTINDLKHHVSISIGARIFPDLNLPSEVEILKQADIAMYAAKKAGRNTFRFFNSAMEKEVERSILFHHDLKTAIIDEQFTLHYQPKFNSNKQIIGAEALVRWQHPQKGLVSPDDFIPIAEKTGLIRDLGKNIFCQSCQTLKNWVKKGLPQSFDHLSVNISPAQFNDPSFVKHIDQYILQIGIDPSLIMLEITENLLLDDIGNAIRTMNQLRNRGFRFSLDDFGTGFSSLSYLKKLPLDELKIDRSFISDIPNNDDDMTIVTTITSMAIHFNLNVVAEGVENLQQINFLKQIGCFSYQGYYFSKPLPEAEINSSWFKKNKLLH